MKKLDVKSIFIGLVIGIIGISIVFAVVWRISETTNEKNAMAMAVTTEEKPVASNSEQKNNVATGEGIKSAAINNSKVYFNGKEVDLKKSLLIIEKDGNSKPELYMPMDELLEYMHFKVEWNNKDNAVYLTMGQDAQENTEVINNMQPNEVDAKAIEIIQKTGNWGYIEKYISQMSDDGIKRVVDIYNSKHSNPSEHKNASHYIKN